MKCKKLIKETKPTKFPCVMEHITKGTIVFFYKEENERVMGVVINNAGIYKPGVYADNWSLFSHPEHWVPVDVTLTHGNENEED